MSLFHDIERSIDEQLRKLFRHEGAPQGREAVEIQSVILDDVSSRIQALPRGRRAFPYNDITFRLLAEDEARQATLYTVFIEGNSLQRTIEQHLRSESVEFPRDLQVNIEIIDDLEAYNAGPFASYHVRKQEPAAQAAVRPSVTFVTADGNETPVDKARIHIGRKAEILDDRRRLIRRNDLAINHDTVSRAHAHIEYIDGSYRLFDDGSTYGTSVIHDGRLLEVPKAGARGQRLSSGDEIYIGQARIRFELV